MTPGPRSRSEDESPPFKTSNNFIFFKMPFKVKDSLLNSNKFILHLDSCKDEDGIGFFRSHLDAPVKPGWRLDYIAMPEGKVANKARDKKNLPHFHEDYLMISFTNQSNFVC